VKNYAIAAIRSDGIGIEVLEVRPEARPDRIKAGM